MAGHAPDQIRVPDKEYSQRTRETAKKIINHLKTNGWGGIANPELAQKLNSAIVWPEDKDLNKTLPYATHDYNIQKDQSGKDVIVDPQIKFDEQTGQIDVSGLSTQFFSLDAKRIAQTNIQFALSMSGRDIYNQMAVANSSKLTWENYPAKLNDANLPQVHFALSLTAPGRPELETELLKHRGNHGRIAKHLHLRIGNNAPDSLIQFSSHTPKDGQAANADITAIAKALGITTPAQLHESIKVNPFYPNTSAKENPTQSQLEKNLELTDVEIGINFDSNLITENQEVINWGLLAPTSRKILEVLRSHVAFEAIRKIDGVEHSLPAIRQLHQDVIKILNPELNRHTLLGLILEQDGPTANCVFPFQKYARLAFSLFPNIKQEIQNLVNPNVETGRTNFGEIEKAIRLALTDQTLARLGLSPLGFLAIYASQSQALAQSGAGVLTPEAKAKTDILFQVSELKTSLASSFTSALSRFVKSISGGIATINDRMTARVDLTNNNLLKRLNFDPNRMMLDLYQGKIPINPKQSEIFKKEYEQFSTVWNDLYNTITFGHFEHDPTENANFLDCVATLKRPDHFAQLLQPYGVKLEKIDEYIQLIIEATAYHHFANRKNEWELFSSKLADHYATQD